MNKTEITWENPSPANSQAQLVALQQQSVQLAQFISQNGERLAQIQQSQDTLDAKVKENSRDIKRVANLATNLLLAFAAGILVGAGGMRLLRT